MMIAARNAMLMGGAKLPYDAEVEYLGSNGTSYFNLTPYLSASRTAKSSATNTLVINLTGYLKSQYGWLTYATLYSNRGYALSMAEYPEVKYLYGSTQSSSVIANQKHTYTVYYGSSGTKSSVSIDGTEVLTSASITDFWSWTTFAVFCNYNLSSVMRAGSSFYGLTILKNGETTLDLIPVRIGQVGFLYDRAAPTGGPYSNGLFPSSGSGSCVIGPDKI